MRWVKPLAASNIRHRAISSASRLQQRIVRARFYQDVRSSRVIIQPQPQPTIASEDGARMLRARKHGHGSLPLPPLMDPILIESRGKYSQKKLDPEEHRNMTELQKELQLNFYARALAGPVRICCVTKARLPTHFLLPFTANVTTQPPAGQSSLERQAPLKASLALIPNLAPAGETPQESTPGTSYVLNSHYMVKHLSKRKGFTVLVTPRMQEKYSDVVGKRAKKDLAWTWDPEMQDRILGDLRKHAIWTISYGLQRQRIVPVGDPSNASDCPPAAILQIGSPVEPFHHPQTPDSPAVNVYRLVDLLGADIENKLLAEAGISENTSQLAVLQHHRNFKLLFSLDKLYSYIRLRSLTTTQSPG